MAHDTEPAVTKRTPVSADVWVLVDGRVRFQRRQIDGGNGAYSLEIPIREREHFLTLAATDGGNGIAADWIVFGDPRLDLKMVQPFSKAQPQSK